MFKTAVLGPIKPPISRSCMECALEVSREGAFACNGFGPGCLGYQRHRASAQAPEDRSVRFTLRREIA